VRTMPAGATLRIETLAPAVVHWGVDCWHSVRDTATRDTTLGVHVVDLPTTRLQPGATLEFTFYWPEVDHWEGVDFGISVQSS